MVSTALGLLAAALASTSLVHAQVLTPGAVSDTLKSERPAMPATPAQVMLPVQSTPSQHDPRGRRFRVNAFDMDGNTVFSDRALKTVIERFVDLELNLFDLTRAAETITAFYHERGYTLARAYIPAQRVEHGVVRIQVIEGAFGHVGFSGNSRYSTAFLEQRTHNFGHANLVTTERLETDLLLLNDLPGLTAKAVLSPSTQVGATDADIRIEEQLFNGSIAFNNHGRKETGRYRADVSVSVNSLEGWGEQFNATGSLTEDRLLRYWNLAYSIPLGTRGTRLGIGGSRASFESRELAILDIRGEVENAQISISHPFMRTRAETHIFNVALKHTRLTQSALGLRLADNELSVVNASWQVNLVHPDSAVTNAMFGLTTNFKSGSTFAKQDAVAARMEVDISHISPFYKNWDIYLRGNAVFNRDMLPDTEKFSIGGPASVRAYRSAEYRGDSGTLLSAEMRRHFYMNNIAGTLRFGVDAANAVFKAPGYKDSQRKLGSYSIGATVYPARGVVASIDIAKPLVSKTASDDKNTRIWISASASF